MLDAQTLLDRQYHEMRWRILSLAADFDRLDRAAGGEAVVVGDPRLKRLRQCLEQLLRTDTDRAEAVQMILSDRTPDPRKTAVSGS